jgi:hypothetical protein
MEPEELHRNPSVPRKIRREEKFLIWKSRIQEEIGRH